MKGHRLIISILAKLSFVLATLMVALNLYPSWSQYARSIEEPLLLATLSAISSMFLIRSFTHHQGEKELTRIFKTPIRIKHANRYTGFLFIGVLCTPVTHPEWYIQTLHMAFTFLAIAWAYLEIINFYSKKVSIFLSWVGLAFATIGMVGGLFLHLWSVGVGELMAAFPILVHILNSNN